MLPDIYVSEKLRDIIESNGLTGVSFDREVKDYKGREMPKYYVMTVHNVLPPMSDTTWLWQEYNGPQCGHNTLYLRSDVQYEREKLEDVNDFNLTAEYVDNFKLRELIVTAKVRHLFLQHKVYSGFYPVAFSNGETQYSDDLLQEIMDIDRLSRPKRS